MFRLLLIVSSSNHDLSKRQSLTNIPNYLGSILQWLLDIICSEIPLLDGVARLLFKLLRDLLVGFGLNDAYSTLLGGLGLDVTACENIDLGPVEPFLNFLPQNLIEIILSLLGGRR